MRFVGSIIALLLACSPASAQWGGFGAQSAGATKPIPIEVWVVSGTSYTIPASTNGVKWNKAQLALFGPGGTGDANDAGSGGGACSRFFYNVVAGQTIPYVLGTPSINSTLTFQGISFTAKTGLLNGLGGTCNIVGPTNGTETSFTGGSASGKYGGGGVGGLSANGGDGRVFNSTGPGGNSPGDGGGGGGVDATLGYGGGGGGYLQNGGDATNAATAQTGGVSYSGTLGPQPGTPAFIGTFGVGGLCGGGAGRNSIGGNGCLRIRLSELVPANDNVFLYERKAA